MQPANRLGILTEDIIVHSQPLHRNVRVDFFIPRHIIDQSPINLLLINDGQNMKELQLERILDKLYGQDLLEPVLCVGIHAGPDRKLEYGTAIQADYLGRGAKAGQYTAFVMQELLPLIATRFGQSRFKEKGFAGFSLGGLMALDIAWNYPGEFSKAGVFSGSLWWRSLDHSHDLYEDELHRIMHQQIKKGRPEESVGQAKQKFFLTTGSLDETHDRNKNGIIDSIDDTLALIRDLESVGYREGEDIRYINYEDGKHDIATWARAMPEFLIWAWGKSKK